MSAEDVARFGVIALEDSTARIRTIDVGGPEKLTLNQVAEIYERISGRQAAKSHVPLLMMRVMRVVMRPFNPMLSFQITGGILMDTEDQTCDMSATLREYPMKLKRLEDVALELAGRLQVVRFQPANQSRSSKRYESMIARVADALADRLQGDPMLRSLNM